MKSKNKSKNILLKTDNNVKLKNKGLSLKEKFKVFNNLPFKEKSMLESYDWGEDLGKEKFYC